MGLTMKTNRTLAALSIGISLVCHGSARAVPNVQDFNTFMFQDYTDSACPDKSIEQWINYDWWVDEMNDIASHYVGKKDTNDLAEYVSGSYRNTGLNADLVAINTHGGETSSYQGYICGRACNDIYLDDIEPLDAEVEIYLVHACGAFSRNVVNVWNNLRNMHRFGAVVSAGCYGDCNTVNIAGIVVTWDEIGDEIADGASTIWWAWRDGHIGNFFNDDITIAGIGRVGAANCSSRANNVTFQNRNDYYEYQYAHDLAYPDPSNVNSLEFCGYYSNDI